jgi:hypothetical protein
MAVGYTGSLFQFSEETAENQEIYSFSGQPFSGRHSTVLPPQHKKYCHNVIKCGHVTAVIVVSNFSI